MEISKSFIKWPICRAEVVGFLVNPSCPCDNMCSFPTRLSLPFRQQFLWAPAFCLSFWESKGMCSSAPAETNRVGVDSQSLMPARNHILNSDRPGSNGNSQNLSLFISETDIDTNINSVIVLFRLKLTTVTKPGIRWLHNNINFHSKFQARNFEKFRQMREMSGLLRQALLPGVLRLGNWVQKLETSKISAGY